MRLAPSVLALACAATAAGCADPARSPARDIVLPVFASSNASNNFNASPHGSGEVPANDSRGRGSAIFHLSDDGTTLHYKLIVANIDHVTQSHIHLAAKGVNGPVVVFLFGFVAGGVTENGVLAEGDITAANLIPRPAIGFGATMPELVAAMRTGGAYVNVHTVALPAGEIRDQVKENGPTH
ncbi:MAG TPA: CHRD domain-containing protein [Longimicrobium sp.]|nr:CHRD domain-containing protein [Longimicrobium sp.]